MSIKLKIKFGSNELEYEGPEEFLKVGVPETLGKFSEFSTENTSSKGDEVFSEGENNSEEGASSGEEVPNGAEHIKMATNSIAAKLDVKSGPDLVVAACAHLDLVLGKGTFTRKEILEDMKSARNYFKDGYSKNLTHSLSSLLKDNKLIQRSNDQYALTADQKKWLESNLGQ